ncbi:MAG: hypothetical protein EZS28_000788 [Streblomastix strix]|uniref:Protein kinase domain-containing protein n=1 Tax=Streblomastix strix TaxID=222440 RepID=A0A5J4XAZ2_9EUKA|nr:MAG: hypothetical protein EZS28_000788 [Streblomastix strix]
MCGMILHSVRIGKISGSDVEDFEISEQNMIDVLEALEQAHINGWYHRDMSPSNFMIVNNNEIRCKQTSDKKRLCIINWENAVERSIGGGIQVPGSISRLLTTVDHAAWLLRMIQSS